MPKEDLPVMTETVHGFMPPVARRVWFSRGAAGLVRLETKERSRKGSNKDCGTDADHSMPRLGSFRLHEGASLPLGVLSTYDRVHSRGGSP